VTTLWSIYALARADFFERTRRYQYLATIAVTLFVGTLLVPAKTSGYSTFLIDGYRGIYNSAWIGALFAILSSMMLSLFAFYNVKSSVQRDRETRVGEIVASTTIGKLAYTTGKALSNFAVLCSMAAIFFVVAIVMQLVRGESYALDLWQIAEPMLLIVTPVLAVVAAVAVLFEMLPWLRGGLGNIAYFFLWIFSLTWLGQFSGKRPWYGDFLGIDLITGQISKALRVVDPRAKPDDVEIGGEPTKAGHLFVWHGFHWSTGDVVERLMWFGVALAIVCVAALVFDRFASGTRGASERKPNAFVEACRVRVERLTTPVLDIICASDFGAIVLAELRLLLNGLGFWWYVVAAGLFIAGLVTKGDGQSIVLGLAWIWPMLQWSQLGTREAIYETEQFIWPTLHPIRRQLVAQWIAGIALALVTGGGSLLHFVFTHDPVGIAGVVAGAIFISTLALACGALSGTTRTFEIVYLVLWYVGPMNRTNFDFTQGVDAASFALASIVLFAVAVASRQMRLQSA
jgi:hypothetical protein